MPTKQSRRARSSGDEPMTRGEQKHRNKMRRHKDNGPSDKRSSNEHTEQKRKRKKGKQREKRPLRRIFPIWLRLIVIPLLCFAALIAGMMVGYGILGDGKAVEALDLETWKHIFDIVRNE